LKQEFKYMNRISRFGFLFTMAIATVLFAQQNSPAAPEPPSATEMAQHNVRRLTHMLSLTSDQQSQATTIFTTEANSSTSFRSGMKAAHTALAAAIQKNDVAAITTAAEQIGTLTTQQTEAHAKAQAAFYQILNPDQQTKFAQMLTAGPGFGGPRGHGFGGPGPGAPPPAE
jgi:Spy/CpxP family protein refolding chaperone